MVDDKQVIIGSDKTGVLTMMYGTGVKGSPETQESTTDTFSGAVVQGKKKVAWNLEISKLRYEGMEQHQELSERLESMMENSDDITVIETVYPKGDHPYQVIDHYYGCLVNGNDYEIKPSENTAESLKFRASTHKREWNPLPMGYTSDSEEETQG